MLYVKLLDLIKTHFLQKDFVLFVVIGTINTFNGIGSAFAYSMFLQANLAFVLGYITALIIAYLLNTWFVFHSKPEFAQLIKFALSYIPNFVIQNVFVLVLYNGVNLPILLVYALAAVVGVPLTFIILKLYAFNNRGKNEKIHSEIF